MIKQRIPEFILAIAFIVTVPLFFGFFIFVAIEMRFSVPAFLLYLLFLLIWGAVGATLSEMTQLVWRHVLFVGGPALICFFGLNRLLFLLYMFYFLPVSFLPSILLGISPGSPPRAVTNLIGLTLMAGVYIFFCYRQKKRTQSNENEE